MKFTKDFMSVLKVLSGVNQNMYFRKGNIQTSCVTTKNDALVFFVRAKTDVEIEQDFAIGQLGNFINVLNLFDDPEIEMSDKGSLIVSGGDKKVTFRLTNPDFIRYHKDPDKIQPATVGIKADLTEQQVTDIHKMYGIFDAKYVSFQGIDGDFRVNIHSGEDVNYSNNGMMVIGKTDETFTATIKAEFFHMPNADYSVLVSRKGYLYFGNETFEYFIPVDENHSILKG